MSTTDAVRLDAVTLGAKIAAKELSSEEVTRACLDRIAETDGKYQAFLHVARSRRWRRPLGSTPRWPPARPCRRR
jgi:aspartyl-tRNA(Asn)/glutamyl-tRNA(Gln) amidotransferase subunit A